MPRKKSDAASGLKFSNRPKGGIRGRKGRASKGNLAAVASNTSTAASTRQSSPRRSSPRRSSPRRQSPKAADAPSRSPPSPKGKRRPNPDSKRKSRPSRDTNAGAKKPSDRKNSANATRARGGTGGKTLLVNRKGGAQSMRTASSVTRRNLPPKKGGRATTQPSVGRIAAGTKKLDDEALKELQNNPVHLATHLEQMSQEMKCFETIIRAPSNPSTASNLDDPDEPEDAEEEAEDSSAFGKVSKAKSIKELFELLDAKGDGSLSEKAFASKLTELGFKIPKAKLGRLFKKFSGGSKKFSYRDFGRAIKSHKAKIEAGDGAVVLYELAGMDAKAMRAKAGGGAPKPRGPPGADKIQLANAKENIRPPLRPYIYHHPQVLSALGGRLSSYIQLHPETDRLIGVIDQLAALCKSAGLTVDELLEDLQPVKMKWGLLSAADIQAGGIATGSVVFKGKRFQRNISWMPDFAQSDSEHDDEAENDDEITEEEIKILDRCWRGIWVLEAILRQARTVLLTLENLLAYDDTDFIQRRLRSNEFAEVAGGGPVSPKDVKIRIFELKTRARDMNPGQVAVAAMTYLEEALHFRELAREWLERKFENSLSGPDKKLGFLSYTGSREDAEMAYTSIRTRNVVPLEVAHGGLHSRAGGGPGDDEKGDPPAIEKASKVEKVLRAIPQLVSVARQARAALNGPEAKREKNDGLVMKSKTEQEEDFVSLLPLFTAEGAISAARERLAELRKAIVDTTPMAAVPEKKKVGGGDGQGEPDMLKANVLLDQLLDLLVELQPEIKRGTP